MKDPTNMRGDTHAFAFYGGNLLRRIGASWFVSFAYHKHVDAGHLNWNRVSVKMRSSIYEKSFSYHRYWLDKIMSMNDRLLDTNKLGLTSLQVKDMAGKVMSKAW